jgi:hypothetical protein
VNSGAAPIQHATNPKSRSYRARRHWLGPRILLRSHWHDPGSADL